MNRKLISIFLLSVIIIYVFIIALGSILDKGIEELPDEHYIQEELGNLSGYSLGECTHQFVHNMCINCRQLECKFIIYDNKIVVDFGDLTYGELLNITKAEIEAEKTRDSKNSYIFNYLVRYGLYCPDVRVEVHTLRSNNFNTPEYNNLITLLNTKVQFHVAERFDYFYVQFLHKYLYERETLEDKLKNLTLEYYCTYGDHVNSTENNRPAHLAYYEIVDLRSK